MSYTREQVEAAVKSKGYVYFEDVNNKGFDVNIVGIRNSSTGQKVTNAFDDTLTISYKENGEWKFHSWPATTDPGKKGVLEYHNAAGVARLVEGQYRGSHTIRLHQGKYEALGQAKNVKVYRDANKDLNYDENKIQEGLFGINIHRANPKGVSKYIDKWSAGCQVLNNSEHFAELLSKCKKSGLKTFTYTLLKEFGNN